MCRIKKAAALLLALLLSALPALPAKADSEHIPESDIHEDSVSYKTATAVTGDFTQETTKTSQISRPITVEVPYEGTDGKLIKNYVAKGRTVEKGELLAEVGVARDNIGISRQELLLEREKESFQRSLDQKNESLDALREQLKNTTDPYGVLKLDIRKRIVKAEIEQLTFEEERKIAQMEEALLELRSQPETVEILAPVSGTLTSVTALRSGDEVRSGMVLYEMTDDSVLLIQAEEASFRYGMDVDVTVTRMGGKEEHHEGRVVMAPEVIPGARFNSALVEFKTPVNDTSGWTRTYTSGVTKRMKDVTLIPFNSAELVNGVFTVVLLDDAGVLHTRRISAGLSGKETIWVLNGVRPGDTLVIR